MLDNDSADQASPAPADGSGPPPVPPERAALPEPDGAAPQPAGKSAVAWIRTLVRRLAQIAWSFVCAVVQYYWGIRRELWECVIGYVNVSSESVMRREVRLAAYESNPLVDFDSAGWKVAIPDRCVVCGEKTANPPVDEFRELDDAVRALLVPLGTLVAGAALGLVFWTRWVLILSIPLGFVLGYVLRKKVHVQLRLKRCDQHAGRNNIPDLLAWGNTLVLRFGHKTVRQVFLFGETMETSVPAGDAAPDKRYTPVERPPSPAPETIPLAEDAPEGASSTIRHDAHRPMGQEESTDVV